MTNSLHHTLSHLRQRAHSRRTEPVEPFKPATLGQHMADLVAAAVGSWRFVLIQSALLIGWIIFNAVSGARFDPFPFILLNLLLSFQAAYTAPIIMMSQNRQSEIDRKRAIEDYDVNCKAEIEIETLHEKIDLLREQEIAQLTVAVARLTKLLEARA
jgi:uncharacterized membrane protein